MVRHASGLPSDGLYPWSATGSAVSYMSTIALVKLDGHGTLGLPSE